METSCTPINQHIIFEREKSKLIILVHVLVHMPTCPTENEMYQNYNKIIFKFSSDNLNLKKKKTAI